tara:strand:+ start:352 stop:648 length:297 start_codon:yes stop_codon:yes gene_type:complete
MSRLKNVYIDALKTHDWNYESRMDEDFEDGAKEKDFIRSIVAEAYEMGKDPAKLFYKFCPEHLYKLSADYGIRTPWEELRLHLDILRKDRQDQFKKIC